MVCVRDFYRNFPAVNLGLSMLQYVYAERGGPWQMFLLNVSLSPEVVTPRSSEIVDFVTDRKRDL